jgi:hypothetical protein
MTYGACGERRGTGVVAIRVGRVISRAFDIGGGDEACAASVDLASCVAALEPSHDTDPEEIADGVGVAENAWVACDRRAVPAGAWFERLGRPPLDSPDARANTFLPDLY